MTVAKLLSLDDAMATVLEHCRALPSERVAIGEAAGRVLAVSAQSVVDLPPFRASAMDGYAVRAADTPGRLPIAFRIGAGHPAPRPLAPGEAMAIATGGVVPELADAVVPIEDVTELDDSVEIDRAVEMSANVRPVGRDAIKGAEVVGAGTRLGPGHIAALAAAGIAEAMCARRPQVAVLATGTELRPPGTELALGEVYESNGLMLAAQLRSVGADVHVLPAAADDEAAHRDAIARGLEFDVLVTSGGVSVGPHDLVRAIERELGVIEIFWGVAVKPGKPVAFGRRDGTLVFGLPGNPVSSLVACELFVRPAVLALQGAAEPGPRFEVGRLAAHVTCDPRRDMLLRARSTIAADGVRLEPVAGQESHMIARAAAADALVLVPRGDGSIAAGSPVRYVRTA